MFKNKELEYVERAFQIERDSYNNTIEYLRDKVRELGAELIKLTTSTTKDLSSETIKQLETEKENLQVQNELLKTENERLQKELDQCSKSLNNTQYKEYKRLKQAEYQRRWLKKKQAQAKQ